MSGVVVPVLRAGVSVYVDEDPDAVVCGPLDRFLQVCVLLKCGRC